MASLFGVVTVIAGTRVLAGSDPGYIVFWPLLLYNTVMGIGYVVAGLVVWRNIERGKHAAAAIFVLNRLVLGIIGCLYAAGGSCCHGESSRHDLSNRRLARSVPHNSADVHQISGAGER